MLTQPGRHYVPPENSPNLSNGNYWTFDEGFYVAADKLKRETDLKVISLVRHSSVKRANSYENISRLRYDDVIVYGKIAESDLSPTLEGAVWSIFKTYGYISAEDELARANRSVKMVSRKHIKKFTYENGMEMLFERKVMLEEILKLYHSDQVCLLLNLRATNDGQKGVPHRKRAGQ